MCFLKFAFHIVHLGAKSYVIINEKYNFYTGWLKTEGNRKLAAGIVWADLNTV